MTRHLTRSILFVAFAFIASWAAAEDGPGLAMNVKRSHLFGSSSGTLRITADGIEYDTTATDDARRWPYAEIKQLQIRSPKRMVVLTYEDQGRLKLGADRTFEFEVEGGGITNELVAFLLAHTDGSIVTAVLPRLSNGQHAVGRVLELADVVVGLLGRPGALDAAGARSGASYSGEYVAFRLPS